MVACTSLTINVYICPEACLQPFSSAGSQPNPKDGTLQVYLHCKLCINYERWKNYNVLTGY